MKPLIYLLAVVGISLCIVTGARSQTINPFGLGLQYSAVLVASVKNGPTITEKLFSSDGKMRIVSTLKGETQVAIIQPELKMGYVIMNKKKTLMQLPLSPTYLLETIFEPGQSGSVQTTDQETVEGISCIKSRVTLPTGVSYTYWRSVADKSPVKVEGDQPAPFSILWKNYQIGSQDESLFTVPKGFQKVSLPGVR